MTDSRLSSCKRCFKPLAPEDFAQDRAMVLLGRAYCSFCLEAMTPTCHLCRKPVHEADFADGRAVTLQGVRFCDSCMEQAVRSEEPLHVVRVEKPDLGGKSRRASIRFVPPLDCELILKPSGLKGLLSANVAKLWIDVSEGGLRAIVQGKYPSGDLLQGKFVHPELDGKMEFEGVVRHARLSERFPDCTLVGLMFQEPSTLLQAFIRDVLGRDPGMYSLNPPTPKPRPPSARSA
ncbi:MAG: PilZ domain-containing protein [Planctomycetaceae bacterium]|nr:PilZ domain-containing protein [Planctomycetaceae bacterium]